MTAHRVVEAKVARRRARLKRRTRLVAAMAYADRINAGATRWAQATGLRFPVADFGEPSRLTGRPKR